VVHGGAIVDTLLDNIPSLATMAVSKALAATGNAAAAVAGPVAGVAFERLGGTTFLRNGAQRALAATGRANPLSRPLYPGESHMVEGPTSRYPLSSMNFMGPNTAVEKRLQRGDRPVNDVDRVAMRHDVAYVSARNPADVRAADIEALAGFKRATDDRPVAKLGAAAMKGKMALEDRGLLDPMRYIGDKTTSGTGYDALPGGNLVALADAIHRKARRERQRSKR